MECWAFTAAHNAPAAICSTWSERPESSLPTTRATLAQPALSNSGLHPLYPGQIDEAFHRLSLTRFMNSGDVSGCSCVAV